MELGEEAHGGVAKRSADASTLSASQPAQEPYCNAARRCQSRLGSQKQQSWEKRSSRPMRDGDRALHPSARSPAAMRPLLLCALVALNIRPTTACVSGNRLISDLGQSVRYDCQPGQVIDSVPFASFGQPFGSCEARQSVRGQPRLQRAEYRGLPRDALCRQAGDAALMSTTTFGADRPTSPIARPLFGSRRSCIARKLPLRLLRRRLHHRLHRHPLRARRCATPPLTIRARASLAGPTSATRAPLLPSYPRIATTSTGRPTRRRASDAVRRRLHRPRRGFLPSRRRHPHRRPPALPSSLHPPRHQPPRHHRPRPPARRDANPSTLASSNARRPAASS